MEVLNQLGLDVEEVGATNEEYEEILEAGAADMIVGGWYADFPDTHSIVQGLLDTRVGSCRTLCEGPGLQKLIERAQFETATETRESPARISSILETPEFGSSDHPFRPPSPLFSNQY